MINPSPDTNPKSKKPSDPKVKIYDLPRKSEADISPAGITYVREKSFTELSAETQAAIKRKEITLDEAWEKEFGKFEGAYSTAFSDIAKEKIIDVVNLIENQNDLSKQIFAQLTISELTNFRNAVSLHLSLGKNLETEKKGDVYLDKPTFSNVYGSVDTIFRLNKSFLSKMYNLEQLHQEAKRLKLEEDKKETSEKYAKDLTIFIEANGYDIDGINFEGANIINSDLEFELREIFYKNSAAKWHSAFISNKNISDDIKALTLKKIKDYQKEDNEKKKKADPRHNGEITDSFLSLLNPDKKPEQIGDDFMFRSEKLRILEIFGKKDLKKESDTLGHCLGNSNTYFHAIRDGDIKIISIQDQSGTPKYTIAYNPRDNSISQFRGESNTPINPQLSNAEFPLIVFNILEQSGVKVNSIKEALGYNIVKIDGLIQSVDQLDIEGVLSFIRAGQENRVIKSKMLKPSSDIPYEDLILLTQAEGLSLDLTDVPESIKNMLTEVKGDLLDNSQTLRYEKLSLVGGNLVFPNLFDATGLGNLTQIGGQAILPKLVHSKGLESLERIEGNALFIDLTETENLQKLRKIGGYAAFLNLKRSKGLSALREIGGNANFLNLEDASDLKSLIEIGANANFLNLVNSDGLDNLVEIGGTADFTNLRDGSGFKSLRKIVGKANFLNLVDSTGFESLIEFGADADLPNLRKATGLVSLRRIGGTANLLNLQDSTGLNSLLEIAGDANLPNLTNGTGLIGLRSIGGTANLLNLKNVSGLEDLENIGRFEYFYQLVKEDKLKIKALRKRYQ